MSNKSLNEVLNFVQDIQIFDRLVNYKHNFLGDISVSVIRKLSMIQLWSIPIISRKKTQGSVGSIQIKLP